MKRFRGGLVFKAHRLLYHSTLGLRVMKKKKKRGWMEVGSHLGRRLPGSALLRVTSLRLLFTCNMVRTVCIEWSATSRDEICGWGTSGDVAQVVASPARKARTPGGDQRVRWRGIGREGKRAREREGEIERESESEREKGSEKERASESESERERERESERERKGERESERGDTDQERGSETHTSPRSSASPRPSEEGTT